MVVAGLVILLMSAVLNFNILRLVDLFRIALRLFSQY